MIVALTDAQYNGILEFIRGIQLELIEIKKEIIVSKDADMHGGPGSIPLKDQDGYPEKLYKTDKEGTTLNACSAQIAGKREPTKTELYVKLNKAFAELLEICLLLKSEALYKSLLTHRTDLSRIVDNS